MLRRNRFIIKNMKHVNISTIEQLRNNQQRRRIVYKLVCAISGHGTAGQKGVGTLLTRENSRCQTFAGFPRAYPSINHEPPFFQNPLPATSGVGRCNSGIASSPLSIPAENPATSTSSFKFPFGDRNRLQGRDNRPLMPAEPECHDTNPTMSRLF